MAKKTALGVRLGSALAALLCLAATAAPARAQSDAVLRAPQAKPSGQVPAAQPKDPEQAAASPARSTDDDPVMVGTEAELASPGLRISGARLKALLAAGDVLVLDVRDSEGYVAGHIPGAILAPLDDLSQRLPDLKKERRPIVTVCT